MQLTSGATPLTFSSKIFHITASMFLATCCATVLRSLSIIILIRFPAQVITKQQVSGVNTCHITRDQCLWQVIYVISLSSGSRKQVLQALRMLVNILWAAKMLTPAFELNQDDVFVYVYIKTPYIKVSRLYWAFLWRVFFIILTND